MTSIKITHSYSWRIFECDKVSVAVYKGNCSLFLWILKTIRYHFSYYIGGVCEVYFVHSITDTTTDTIDYTKPKQYYPIIRDHNHLVGVTKRKKENKKMKEETK